MELDPVAATLAWLAGEDAGTVIGTVVFALLALRHMTWPQRRGPRTPSPAPPPKRPAPGPHSAPAARTGAPSRAAVPPAIAGCTAAQAAEGFERLRAAMHAGQRECPPGRRRPPPPPPAPPPPPGYAPRSDLPAERTVRRCGACHGPAGGDRSRRCPWCGSYWSD